MKFQAFILSAILLVVTLIVVDCSFGKTRYAECRVSDKLYKPAWTETQTSTDSDGHTSITTIHHPEEYHVFCSEYDSGTVFDCQTVARLYAVYTNQQPVTVKARIGRWTGVAYIPQITE